MPFVPRSSAERFFSCAKRRTRTGDVGIERHHLVYAGPQSVRAKWRRGSICVHGYRDIFCLNIRWNEECPCGDVSLATANVEKNRPSSRTVPIMRGICRPDPSDSRFAGESLTTPPGPSRTGRNWKGNNPVAKVAFKAARISVALAVMRQGNVLFGDAVGSAAQACVLFARSTHEGKLR